MIKNNSIRKFKRDVKAVSPVIATILLVLVAVASAVAFWAILDGWQGQQSDKLDGVDFNSGTLSGNLAIAGSSTVAPFVEAAIAGFTEINTNVKVAYNSVDSGFGRSTIEAGTVDIGAISDNWGSKAADADYPGIVATTIGYDGVVVATNHVLTNDQLGAMTKAIISDVYDGTITSWEQLINVLNGNAAGTDETTPINVIVREEGSGTLDTFKSKILESDTVIKSSATVANGNAAVVTALVDVNAIGFTSFGHASNAGLSVFSINDVAPTLATIQDGTYAAGRPLVLLTNGEPSGLAKAFIDYILDVDNNKAFAEEAGYVSLYGI